MSQEAGIPMIGGAFARHALKCVFAVPWLSASSRLSPAADPVPRDFLGICVASSDDPGCDDYVLARLEELGIRHARLDMTYGDEDSAPGRLLDRLLRARFRVCLHLVQPPEEAARMNGSAARAAWQSFVGRVLDRWGAGVEMVEIGTTCNRRRWTGHTLGGFMEAWRIGRREAVARGVAVAGPNVTDFEPVYNAGLLGVMKSEGSLPDAHTDNLFVERATQPEAFDPKILGRALARLGRFNLVKKARILRMISDRYGVGPLLCTHVAWSRRRIERRLVHARQKQADYLARYLCLAAASGCLRRVYWGPMIGQREGLVDDGTSDYPPLPRVAYHGRVCGAVSGYRELPAFHAFRAAAALLPGTRFSGSLAAGAGEQTLFILEFLSDTHRLHAVWTVNGCAAPAADCYEQRDLLGAEAMSRDGVRLPRPPSSFSESPTYLRWPLAPAVRPRPAAAADPAVRLEHPSAAEYGWIRTERWRGMTASPPGAPQPDASALLPENLERCAGKKLLRQGRNTVWEAPHPLDPRRRVVVKRFRVSAPHRRLLDRRRPSRAARAWSGANELLRRGIGTPRPVAFFEDAQAGPLGDSYYVCEAAGTAFPARQAFTAFASGAGPYEGIPASVFLGRLAGFLCVMHERGVFFRDLSAGNVLARKDASGGLEFLLIDTTRLRVAERETPWRQRLSDLVRVCHPLHWAGRRELLAAYAAKAGRRVPGAAVPLMALYDLKHRVKNALRPLRGRPRP